MTPATVVFFMLISLPGNPPMFFEEKTASLAECLFEVHEFLVKPSHELLIRGGMIQVGCRKDFSPSEEH